MIDWGSIKKASGLSESLQKRLSDKPVLYHGSPNRLDVLKGSKTGEWHGDGAKGSVFVTPYPAIAADFALDKARILEKVEKKLKARIDKVNFGYDTWDSPLEDLDGLPKRVDVKLNLRGFKSVRGKTTGYLHKVDYKGLEGRSKMYDRNPDSDVEFLVNGDVIPTDVRKVRLKWRAVPSEEEMARKGEGHVTPWKDIRKEALRRESAGKNKNP